MTSASLSSRPLAPPRRRRATDRAIFAAFVVGLSLASCEVGPDYSPPAIALAPFHNAEAVDERAVRSPTPPLDQWWTASRIPS